MKVSEAVRFVRPRPVFIHDASDYGYIHIVKHFDNTLLAKYRLDKIADELDPILANSTVCLIYPHENMKDIVITCMVRRKAEREVNA